MSTRQRWILRRRPEGAITRDDLELVTEAMPVIADGEVLVRTIYLSLDPTNRIWMSGRDQYMPPVELGETMRGVTLGVVEQSRSDHLQPGQVVSSLGGWTTHHVAKGAGLRPVAAIPGVPLAASAGILGGSGLTAWIGMCGIAKVKAGETVVVSAAAGAVGSAAAQIARLRGAKVIGIAGGSAKCAWLKHDLGLDGTIDYRSEDVGAALDRLAPEGIDVCFENVGGAILDATFARMNDFGRIALCGLISSYNSEGPVAGPAGFERILMHRLTLRGFIVSDHMDLAPQAMTELAGWVGSGQIKWQVHVEHGIENAIDALARLFDGSHNGKLLLQLSPEP